MKPRSTILWCALLAVLVGVVFLYRAGRQGASDASQQQDGASAVSQSEGGVPADTTGSVPPPATDAAAAGTKPPPTDLGVTPAAGAATPATAAAAAGSTPAQEGSPAPGGWNPNNPNQQIAAVPTGEKFSLTNRAKSPLVEKAAGRDREPSQP
jgi:hypothetical protein